VVPALAVVDVLAAAVGFEPPVRAGVFDFTLFAGVAAAVAVERVDERPALRTAVPSLTSPSLESPSLASPSLAAFGVAAEYFLTTVAADFLRSDIRSAP